MADHPFRVAATANPIVPADAATAIERHTVYVAHDLTDIRSRDLSRTKVVFLVDYSVLTVRRYVYDANSVLADDGYSAIWDSEERAFVLDAGQAFKPDAIVADTTARDALDVSGEAIGYAVLVEAGPELYFLTDPETPTWSSAIPFGASVAAVLTALGINSITVSTSDPSGGSDNDVWFKVSS